MNSHEQLFRFPIWQLRLCFFAALREISSATLLLCGFAALREITLAFTITDH